MARSRRLLASMHNSSFDGRLVHDGAVRGGGGVRICP